MTDDAGEQKPTPNRTRRAFFIDKICLFAFIPTLLSICAYAGALAWQIDLVSHFRMHYALALGAATIALTALRAWRPAIVFLIAFIINAAPLAHMFMPSTSLYEGGHEFTLVHFNVHTANTQYDDVIAALRASNADVIALQEVNRDWLDALEKNPFLKVIAAKPREDNFGIALLIDTAGDVTIDNAQMFDITHGEAMVPAIEATLDVNGRNVDLLYVHTLPPINGEYTRLRNLQLEAAAAWSTAHTGAHMVVGDLNATPFSAPFRRLIRESQLHEDMQGRGYQGTWPDFVPSWLGIPIDHALFSHHIALRKRTVGATHGSDHRILSLLISAVSQ